MSGGWRLVQLGREPLCIPARTGFHLFVWRNSGRKATAKPPNLTPSHFSWNCS